MPMFSVFCHLSRHLVSCHILFHQVSPSQLWSASISLSIYCHLQYLSRGVIFISPLHMSNPSGTCVPLSRCLHFSHDLVLSFLLPTATCAFEFCAISYPRIVAHIVQNFKNISFAEDDDQTCPICLCNFEAGDDAKSLPCQHIFHRLCIKVWIHKVGVQPRVHQMLSRCFI